MFNRDNFPTFRHLSFFYSPFLFPFINPTTAGQLAKAFFLFPPLSDIKRPWPNNQGQSHSFPFLGAAASVIDPFAKSFFLAFISLYIKTE